MKACIEFRWARLRLSLPIPLNTHTLETLCWTQRHRQTPANERNANAGGSAATPPFSGCASPNPAQPGEAPAQSPQWLISMPAGPLLLLPR